MTQSKEFPQYAGSIRSRTRRDVSRVSRPSPSFTRRKEVRGKPVPRMVQHMMASPDRRHQYRQPSWIRSSTIQVCMTTDEYIHATGVHGNDVGTLDREFRQGRSDVGAVGRCGERRSDRAGDDSSWVWLSKKYGKARFHWVNLTATASRRKERLRGAQGPYSAWPEDGGTHTDLALSFPWSKMFARITQLETPPKPVTPPEELPVDGATFNKLMDGWAASTNGKKLIGEAVAATKTPSKPVPQRTLQQALVDISSQIRPILTFPSDHAENVQGGLPMNNPIRDSSCSRPAHRDRGKARDHRRYCPHDGVLNNPSTVGISQEVGT